MTGCPYLSDQSTGPTLHETVQVNGNMEHRKEQGLLPLLSMEHHSQYLTLEHGKEGRIFERSPLEPTSAQNLRPI